MEVDLRSVDRAALAALDAQLQTGAGCCAGGRARALAATGAADDDEGSWWGSVRPARRRPTRSSCRRRSRRRARSARCRLSTVSSSDANYPTSLRIPAVQIGGGGAGRGRARADRVVRHDRLLARHPARAAADDRARPKVASASAQESRPEELSLAGSRIGLDLLKSCEVRRALAAGGLAGDDEAGDEEQVNAADDRELDSHRLRQHHRHKIAHRRQAEEDGETAGRCRCRPAARQRPSPSAPTCPRGTPADNGRFAPPRRAARRPPRRWPRAGAEEGR